METNQSHKEMNNKKPTILISFVLTDLHDFWAV